MATIGFIGTGVMGSAMAQNLLRAGHKVQVYNRTRSKAQSVLEQGGIWKDSVMECAVGCDYVITMVGYPQDVEQVYFNHGILESARPGAILIDMTTTDPALSVRIAQAAQKKGVSALDAPVSGGDTGAKNGTLSIMVGGDRQAFDTAQEVLRCMGTNIVYEGPAGMGQHTKMANQIALAGAVAGVCEAIAYAEHAGLDVPTMLQSIEKGAAGSWQMTHTAPRMVEEDFAPGFYIKHYIKDMRIALEQAQAHRAALPVLEQVLRMYRDLEQDGKGDLGTQALILHYRSDQG